ncbi:MAG: FlgD immunoglobulin-like domain containing protein [bacterium]
MTDKRKKFLISAVALALVLILVGLGLAQADVSNNIIWQQDQNLVPDTNWNLYTMTNNESDSTQKTDSADTNEVHPSAAYDGSKVVYAKWDGIQYDVYYKTNGGPETKIIDDGQYPALGPCGQVAFCRRKLTGGVWWWGIYTTNLSGSGPDGPYYVFWGANHQWPSISPDGKYIIFATDEEGDNDNWEIYQMDYGGGGEINLTNNWANDIDPAYSFDGTQIVFASNRSNPDNSSNYDIYTMPAGGSGSPTQVTTNTAVDQYPFYSPDGSRIVFTSYRDDNKGEIYTIPSGGGDPVNVTRLTNNSYHDRYPTWGGTASAPAAPINLTLSNVAYDSIKLTWTDNSCNEDGFKVKRSTDNVTFNDVWDFPAVSGKGTPLDWTDTGVLKCTQYYYYVQAWNGVGTANSSTVDTFTLDTVPAAPTGLKGTTSCWTCSDTTISLSWTDNAPTAGCSDEDSFSIWASISGGALTIIDTAPQHPGTGAVTNQCFDNLEPDTRYSIRVSADNQYGSSDLSDTIVIPTKPAPPSGLMANAPAADSNGWRQIDLSWSDVSTINDGYYIQRYIVQGTAANDPVETCPCTCEKANYVPDGSAIKLVGSALTDYPDSIGLLPKTCYYYQIRAYVEYYNGSDTTEATCHWEDSNCTNTTDTNPLPPSGLSLSEVDTDSIKISWTDNSGTFYYQQEDSFTVYRTVNNTGTIVVDAHAGSGSTVDTTDTGLTPGTQYCYTVSAWNSISEDTATATVCATTCETDPNKPTGLSLQVKSFSQIDLTWTDNDDSADTDEIWASQDGGAWAKLGDTMPVAAGATNTYSATGLVGGSNYCFKITAVADNTGGCSPTQLTSDSDSACASTNVSNIWVDGPSNNGPEECGGGEDEIQVPSPFINTTNTKVKLDYVKDLNTIQFDVTYDTIEVETVSVSLGSKFSGATAVYNDVETPTGRALKVNIHIPGGSLPLPKVDCPTGCEVITLEVKFAGVSPPWGASLGVENTQMSDNTAQPITVVGECGDFLYLWVYNPRPGDADCDGDTEVADVTYMEYALVGHPDYPVCNVFNLDTTGNGEFNESDITCLQRLLIGLDCSGLLAPIQFPEIATGTVREVAFMVKGIADLDVAYLDVSYAKGIRITGITAGDLTAGATPIFNLEDGRLRMILNMAGVSGVSGSGSIFKVGFVGEGEFSINQVALSSAEATLIGADVTTIITGQVSRAIPTRTRLYQNFPNPLNPETLIPFDLATEAQVTINIYNLSGQLIRSLDLGKLAVGSYVDKEKAAFWNGRDNAGVEVSGGVYLYQIKAGDFTSTRKMIVLK